MKRDMDLVRDLLLVIESHPLLDGMRRMQPDEPGDLDITDHSSNEVTYHLNMLIKAGLVEGKITMQMPIISKLTWQGHDFLDSIRDPVIWRETMEGAKKAGGFSLELLGALAKGLIKKKIEEHTGVQL
ncbi:DUF2513 domain-containing protein [Methylobacter tundripaludum]|jgi:hypothetical protein|uniref:DUF2513 domain-containing protein n=1 Tax=Methylobacter tundripaludum TaxID=173365 RepID=UPI00048A1B71|nr:DUF2513 domain-containing protein [Methylobacter tundripaludum]